jgi:HD-GYP domain-containing protein (c-di-GMP phosphodiesterase class II)
VEDEKYQSAYAMPMYLNGVFFGFVFYQSRHKDPYRPEVLHYLDIFGHLISLVIMNEISAIHTMLAALKTARGMTHHRDVETGAHLDRMSRYAQLIAQELAPKYNFSDEYIEHIFLFAPLHDIGKIGIPDSILLKPDKLNDEEYEIMKSHSIKGRQIIDEMLQNFGLESFHYINVLRNIAEYHHESVNGSGYPHGLKSDDIPIEARIVTVADVFDALTSRRPYKAAWNNDDAFVALRRLAGSRLDKDCVAAIESRRGEVEEIQARFQADEIG